MKRQLCKQIGVSALPLLAFTALWMIAVYFDVVVNQQQNSSFIDRIHPIIILLVVFTSVWILARLQFQPKSPLQELSLCILCVVAQAVWTVITVPLIIYWHVSLGGTL